MIWFRGASVLALSVMLATGAMGQDAPTPPQANNLPNPPTPAAAPAPGSFVPGETGAQSLTSALRGRAVYDPKTEKIGEVGDFVLEADGHVSAVVLAVGGVLGIGAKDVAVPFGDLKTGNRDGKPIFVLDHTAEEVRNAPSFAPAGQPKT